LALHPKFLDATTPKNYVYISYVHKYDSTSVTTNGGVFFTNSIVRFTYNTSTGKLESPVALCDTLPGSSDHNSQRLIIAPVSGSYYLFYGQGDMGAGQFGNQWRTNKAQNQNSYEGKVLRFNLESDGDAGLAAWIPNDNPISSTSAVWSIGIRNNQGFAYDTAKGILYGSSHGPYSDDEINIIEKNKNYGHPIVIGFAADGNYNASSAGSPNTTSSCPLITDEVSAAAAITNYKDPLYSAYAAPAGNTTTPGTIRYIWTNNPPNGGWPSEAWSGMDFYSHTLVPGWKNSLVLGSLKWGRVLRLKLGPLGTTIVPTNGTDTISYFGSQNRFRDIAFAPNGKDMYVIMDRSTTTSGPSSANPVVPTCPGCLQKYTFLGYADAAGKSTIPDAIDVTDGTVNTCNTGTTVTIDNTNNNLWVPITGPDGNIMAEIYANGNNLGTVTSSFYKNSGAIRIKNGNRYLDRNMTITPQTQPSTSVKIRLYISKVEFDALDIDANSGVSAITDLKILKNSDACSNAISAATTLITPTYAEAHGANGYMLQGNISSFSSFYFSSSNIILPLDIVTFSGALQNNSTVLLKWKTENEINTSYFQVERSIDGNIFNDIGTISSNANNNNGNVFNYSFTDVDAGNQQSLLLYYRLKVVDMNGSFKYSNVITISLADITGKLTVSPNPVIGEVKVNISAPADGIILWKLIDNTSRVILQNSEHVRKGNGNIFIINMNKLSRGSYYLSISGAGIDQKVKLQKL
jgi:glucose/arabinose dehydrogenase